MTRESKDRYYVEAVGRGLRILEAFTETSPDLSLTELSQAVDLDKSTVFRFAYTLEKLGYLLSTGGSPLATRLGMMG